MNSVEHITAAFQTSYDGLNEHHGGWEKAGEKFRQLHTNTLIQIAMGLVIANFWRFDVIRAGAVIYPDREIIMSLQIGRLISVHQGDHDASALATRVYEVMKNQGVATGRQAWI